MQPYWVSLQNPPSGFALGVGVTAIDETDARALTTAAIGLNVQIHEVRGVHQVDELDQGHVVPNMGNILKRGIWFPRGFEQT